MDLNYNESQKDGLRVYSLVAFATDLSLIVLVVLASCHHLMMDIKLAKPQGKPLGHYPRQQQIVEFKLNVLDGRSLMSSWFKKKPMTVTERDLSIITN